MTEAAPLATGTRMEDGSVYAGLTADGTHHIYAMPTDLDVTMTFNDAAERVEQLNAHEALGHADWKIPDVDSLHVLHKNRNEAALKGTFKTAFSSGSDFTDWYWSSTPYRVYPTLVDSVRFPDGKECWSLKDNDRLSCRPVRLVPVGTL
jgi:hypothetical protein